MTETDRSDEPDEDLREVSDQRGDEADDDARDAARESAGRAAESEGAPREGGERTSTGNPGAAGADEDG
jgi:hypothetical protein